jgi:hypothetical protein
MADVFDAPLPGDRMAEFYGREIFSIAWQQTKRKYP